MAVQAQYPSNIPVGDFCMRARQSYGNGGAVANGSKNMNGFTYASAPAEDIQFQLMNPSSTLINSIMGGGAPMQPTGLQQFTDELIYNVPNKRPRPADFVPVQHPLQQQHQQHQHQHQHHQQQQQQQQQHHQQQQQPQQQIVQDFHRSSLPRAPVVPGAPNVSTGLRLAFTDDRLSSTAPSCVPKIDLNSSTSQTLSLLSEEIAIELQRQRDEIEQLIRVQEEQLRRVIEEKQQQQARALIGSLERFVARKLREKDVELEKMSRRNMELEERMKQVTMEARMWQTKAKNGEAMVASLRNNLQQAVVLSREQSKEGVGDTADDAESSYPDDTADAHARTFKENKELKEKRTCRVCRSNEVCVLLLPCRHLCLCKECESRLDTCPLCRNPKTASVQVYMS